MRFPCKSTNKVLGEKMLHYTLLDGEMVIDTLPGSQKQERRYLIYDMIAINQVSVIEWPFYKRWKMVGKEVNEPGNEERHAIFKPCDLTFHGVQLRNPKY